MIGFESVDEAHQQSCDKGARLMIWCYFILLLAEGILRKWLLPQLSAPLAVVRDPFLIMAILFALRSHRFPWNGFTITLTFVGLGSLAFGLVPEDSSLAVAINGFRTNFLHFYLVFLMPIYLTRKDVDLIGKICIYLLPFVAALMVYQFYASPLDWINKTTGLDKAAKQLAGTYGNVRPPSIFTFITGVGEFITMASAFVIVAIYDRLKLPKIYPLLAVISILVAVAVSISRFTLFSVILVVLAYVIFALLRPNMAPQLLSLIVCGVVMVVLLIGSGLMEKSLHAFSTRVTLASDYEGGTAGFFFRYLTNFTHPVLAWLDVPWCGYGLGIFTNAGALLTKGNLATLEVENELTRIIIESGLIMGPLFVIWRFALAIFLLARSYTLAFNTGEVLAWLLMPEVLQLVILGQLGRPTTLGFTAFSAGLALTIIHLHETESLGKR